MIAARELASPAAGGWRKLAVLERNITRYHFLTWFLTMVVVMVFMHEVGVDWLRRRYPVLSDRIANHPWSLLLASGLTRLQEVTA